MTQPVALWVIVVSHRIGLEIIAANQVHARGCRERGHDPIFGLCKSKSHFWLGRRPSRWRAEAKDQRRGRASRRGAYGVDKLGCVPRQVVVDLLAACWLVAGAASLQVEAGEC